MKKIGVTFGKASPHQSKAIIIDESLGLFDFLMAGKTLCQISKVIIESDLSKNDAKAILKGDDRKPIYDVVAVLDVLGDINKTIHNRTQPVMVGSILKRASAKNIMEFMNFQDGNVKMGVMLRRDDIPVQLTKKILGNHVSILGKTGKGKSNVAKVLLSQITGERIVIIDPHSEYEGNQLKITEIQPQLNNLKMSNIIERAEDMLSEKDCQRLDFLVNTNGSLKGILDYIKQRFFRDQRKILEALNNSIRLEAILQDIDVSLEILGEDEPLVIDLKGIEEELSERIVDRIARFILNSGKDDRPYHLFIDEAHAFAPQQIKAESKKAIIELARQGRKFNCGLVVMSQRPANVDKNVLSQCNTMFCLNVTNDNDIKQIRASTESSNKQMFDEVQKLRVGQALLVSAYIERPVFVKVDEYKGQ